MKRLFAIALGALAVTACKDVAGPENPLTGPDSPAPLSAVQADTIPGHYIVLLKKDVKDADAATEELMWNRRSAIEQTYRYALKGFAAKLSKAQADSISHNPKVALVQPDLRVQAQSTTIQSGVDWGLDRMDEHAFPLDDRYAYGATGAGVNVYVIDGGVRLTHHEFGGRAHFAFDAFGGSGTDCQGHGTHVAGTIAGATYGVAKKANIYSVKVLDCNGNSTLSKIVAGVDWVTGHRKLPAVANMSLGSVANSTFDDFVRASIASGVTYVTSAGNDNSDACNQSPARVSQVITVASTDPNDYRSSWSNYGGCVDIFAPGNNITSAFNTSDDATRVLGGTSMAAPHVAGAAALYLSAHPGASPSTVQNALLSNATYGYVKNASGSPNRIVYTGFISSSSTTSDAEPAPAPDDDPPTSSNSTGAPTASFSYSCSGTTCTFDASGSTAPAGVLARTWIFGDGSQAGSTKLTKTYASSGTYTVKFYIYDVNMNYAQVTKSVTTGSSGSGSSGTTSPTTSSSTTWSYKCGTNQVCEFDARSLADAGGSAFSWYFGDGTQAGSSHVAEKYYSKSGSYTVTMTMLDKYKKLVTIRKTITVP
ncbi:MAG TPA: S8 family serine peptidase [Gemmatimonadaceae bacterium]|jgi:subtilisin family serine protease|nr:S8 family serine peptidase [Gemmatimonadaceae bacterium]